MKVLHILGELNRSGAERMLACSYPHWRAAGIQPAVVGLGGGVHPFAPAMVDAGYQVGILPPVRSMRGLVALNRAIREAQPQIVHIHTESCFDVVACIASLSPGIAGLVRTVHSSFRFNGMLRTRRTVRASFARQLGVVGVACSAEVAANERSYYANPVQVVENWVDVDQITREATRKARVHIRRTLDIEADEPVLALIGNCGGAKNHELIPTVLRLLERPVHLLHVGDAHNQPDTEARAWLDMPTQHTVHHLGARDDIPRLLAASDLLVFPSLYEGMGLVPAEALCAGVPVLAADTVGLQWLKSVPSAKLVPLEPSSWAAAIAAALTPGPDLSASITMTRQARARFRVERGVNDYFAVYEAALRRRIPLREMRWRFRPSSAINS